MIGTAHLAFGTSAGLGGVNVAHVHIDGVLLRATVELDGEPLLHEGRLFPPRPRIRLELERLAGLEPVDVLAQPLGVHRRRQHAACPRQERTLRRTRRPP